MSDKMDYPTAQLLSMLAWALRDHAMIVSGAYKFRKTLKGREPTEEEKEKGQVIGWEKMTDDDKLKLAMGTFTNRCHFISECVEGIGEEEYRNGQ